MREIATRTILSLALLVPVTAAADWSHHDRGHGWQAHRPEFRAPDGRSDGCDQGRRGIRPAPAGPIWYGFQSGRLSGREARELREEAQQIRWKEHRYYRDGVLSHSERRDLRSDWADFRDSLQHELHDGERRWGW